MVKHIFYSIDLFGHPIQLQIKKDSEYHSILGLLMSLGILALIFYSFLSLLIDMFDRKSPNIIQNIQFQANPEEYQLKQESFLFYLALTDIYGIPITQQENSLIYLARFSYCQRDVDENNQFLNNCSHFLLKPCNQVTINSGIQEKLNISEAVLAASYCFDSEDWNKIELSLQGTPQSVIFKGLQFVIEKCNNETSAGNCAPQEQIEQKLSFAYLGLFVSDYVLNQQKTNNPFSQVSKLIQTSLSILQQKQVTIQMRKSKLFNSENFFYYFEEKTDYSALTFERESEWVLNIQQDQLININFYLDDREVIYYRTYNNIFDILGQMGGLLELMIMVAGTIIRPFNQLQCDLFLTSQIFSFKRSDNQQKLYPLTFEGLGQPEGYINQTQLIQIKKFFKLKAQQVKFFIHQYLFRCDQNKQLIQQSIGQFYRQIDIIFIINKLIEIDKMKKILLNEDQQINYIHKPIIQLGQKDLTNIHTNLYDDNKLSFEEEIIQAMNSYNMIKENNLKKIKKENKTLLNLLDKDIQYILEQQENNKLQKQSSQNQLKEVSFIDLSLQENRIDI